MALPLNLTTNEVKNSAGTEVEFLRRLSPPNVLSFSKSGEAYDLPVRLTLQSTETGVGLRRRRRSVVRFDETSISGVDSITPVTSSFYQVSDIPVGALTVATVPMNVCAYLLSFCATTGAGTTVLYDGTGYGALFLLNGIA
jgi:hypothetical protein